MGDFWKPLRELTLEDVESLKTSGDREKANLDYKQFNRGGKGGLLHAVDLADDFMAFANSGGGRLVLGAVEEREALKDLEGVEEAKIRDVFSTIRNIAHMVQPPVNADAREVKIPDGTYVFVVEIPAGQVGPFQFRGRYMQRASSGNVPMNHTSVVNAVLAVNGKAEYDGDGVLGTGTIHLGDNPMMTQEKRWACGVHLRPVHRRRTSFYDPLDSRLDAVEAWLLLHGYKSADIHRRISTLYCKHNTGRELEIAADGTATAIAYIDANDFGGKISVDQVALIFESLLRDCSNPLDILQPFFTVTVSGRVWGLQLKGFQAVWTEGGEQNSVRTIEKDTPFLAAGREYRVHELKEEVEQQAVATRFGKYFKIHVRSG